VIVAGQYFFKSAQAFPEKPNKQYHLSISLIIIL